ncbi:MAG: hypothetical protein HY056_16400 [Proteobacteria bacterium]|nr:hypothetical protein [Pseudomonadota bacterium]
MKLLRTIRLDVSDTFIFPRAAEPGEWAVPGSFLYWDRELATLEGRERAAFRAGFLGVASFGHSTLAQIVEASATQHSELVATLADRLVAHCGAPDMARAQAAAQEEIAFAASLCGHPADTLIAMHRTLADGEIREAFRTLRPRAGAKPLRAFSFLQVEGEDDAGEPADAIRLADLTREGGG